MLLLLRKTMFRKLFFRPTTQIVNYVSMSKTVCFKRCGQPINPWSYRTLTSVAHEYDRSDVQTIRDDTVGAESVDFALSRIDLQAKQVGRVQKRFVQNVFDKIKRESVVTSIQSLYLIRCCGSLMHEVSPDERIRFANEMWDVFQKLGVPMDASHYNSLLKVYIENDHAFVPTDFLSTMEIQGIAPNRVTYQRLVEKYCEDGNIDGASVILEFMKQKEIPVNSAIFNFLIKGHAKTGDVQGAKQVMEVMRQSKLAPTIDTYLILASCSAEKGDLDSTFSIIDEALDNRVYFSTADYLQLVYHSALHGNMDHINKLLSKLTNMDRYRPEIGNTVLDLQNKGLDDIAYKVILFALENIDYPSLCNMFVRQLVKLNRPVEKVFGYCIDIQKKGFNPRSCQVAAKTALESQNNEYIMEVFGRMQKEGISLRSHYFWPMFVNHTKKKNVDGVIKILKAMYELGVPTNFETYIDYVLPGLTNHNLESVFQLIKQTGHTELSATEALFHFYCVTHDWKNLASLLNKYPVPIDARSALNFIAGHYTPGNNVCLLQILQRLSEQMDTNYEDSQDIFGKFLMQQFKHNKLSKEVINEACEQGVMISRASADQLCSMVRNNPDMMQLIRNLQYGIAQPVERYQQPDIHIRDMSLEQLENHITELRKIGGSTRAALRSLLSHYFKTRDAEKVKEIMGELDEQGFNFTPAMYALMISTFTSSNDLETVSSLKIRLDNEFPEFKLDALKVLEYAALLVKCNKLEEAKELISKDCAEMIISIRHEPLINSIAKFLDVASETKNAEFVLDMYNLAMTTFSITSPNKRLLQSLIKVHINMDNLDKAIEEYKNCIVTYRLFPCRNLLLKICIERNDNERLQYIVDLTTMHGEQIITSHELALVFIECGQFQQAYKIMQQLGDRVSNGHLLFMCERLFADEKVTELEQLLHTIKNLFHVNREELYYLLLQLYAQNNAYEKALELWNLFQEETIQPSVKTLRLLANLLENNNQPIPFVVPMNRTDLEEGNSNEMKPVVKDEDSLISKLNKCLLEKNVNEVTAVLREMRKGHIRLLSTDVMSEIIDLHATNNKLNNISGIVQVMSYTLEKAHAIVKPLLQKYADAGDVHLIKAMLEFLPDFTLKSLNFNNYFHKTYLKADKGEDLLSILETNVGKNLRLFSIIGFHELLNKNPELEDRVAKLVDIYMTKDNFDLPMRILWSHYFINGKYDKAEVIFKKNIHIFNNFDSLASYIMRAIRTGQNADLGKRFINFLNDFEVKQIVKDKAYSCVLDTFVTVNMFPEAVELLKASQNQSIPLRSFSQSSLIQVKNHLSEQGQTLPFAIPIENDSSSSSDSD